jgi:hypothetical protein
MDEFLLQPSLYQTGPNGDLFSVLDALWKNPSEPGYVNGTYYIVSGFGTHNGGVRFFEKFRHHIANGGRVRALLGGSRSMRLTSRQLVAGLIDCGVEVTTVNRNRILHAKLYGTRDSSGDQRLVTTSGNFTWPGMKLNLESVVSLDVTSTAALSFSWEELFDAVTSSTSLNFNVGDFDPADPVWSLFYDELAGRRFGAPPEEVDVDEGLQAMVLTLSHADTARINALPGTPAYRGSQYFWLSKDSYDFFPPLTIRNATGSKATYSTMVEIAFLDLGATHECRVTFEAENNLDFRLGTGPLRGTNIATEGDMAVILRTGELSYQLAMVRAGTNEFFALSPYATTFIGHMGKRVGFAPKNEVNRILGI